MTGKQNIIEQPSKRSLTPNRSLYSSFNEAHRHIAPPAPKLPFEIDLRDEERLTPKQVENILPSANEARSFQEFIDMMKLAKPEYASLSNQVDHNIDLTSALSPSAIGLQNKTHDYGNHVTGSVSGSFCGCDDEHAFIDTSVSSLQNSKIESNQQDSIDDPFASQHAIDSFPDASSFYPEDGATYSTNVSEEESISDHIKLETKPSPILALLPTLLPPITSNFQDPSQQISQSHFDDVAKKQPVSENFKNTHLSGQSGTQYPINIYHGSLPTACNPGMSPPAVKDETKTDSLYDGDISDVSENQLTDQDKDKSSSSRLDPFHAISVASSAPESDVFEQVQPDSRKLFLRPQAEKEVSRALHHATGISQPLSGLLIGRTRLSHVNTSGLHSSSYKDGKAQKDGFYHSPAIQPSWQVTTSGVKIPVPRPYPGHDEASMQETEPYNAIDNNNMATMTSTTDERPGLVGDEDWRTVTDDREDLPAGAIGRVMTGSSIANVSDRILLRQQTQSQGRRAPSTTTAWWERTTPLTPVATPIVPFPAMADLPAPPAPIFARRQRQPDQFAEIELEPMPSHWDCACSRSGAAEPLASCGEYAKLPFPLVSREDAAIMQAVRRASGIEDHTLSGRMTSAGLCSSSIQDSCRNPSHMAGCRRASTTASRNQGLITPRAAANALATSPRDSRTTSPHLVSTEVASRYQAFQAVRNAGGRGTDSELADMAATAGDAALTPMAQRRQKIYYRAIMATTFILPILGYATIACRGISILSVITYGECSGLSYYQRRNLRMMVLGGFALWCIAVVVGLITMAATRA